MEKYYCAPIEYYRHFLEHPGASVANIVLLHHKGDGTEANVRFLLGLDSNTNLANVVERIGDELQAHEQSGVTMMARWSALEDIYFHTLRIGRCKRTDDMILSFLAETACSSMLGRNSYWIANSLQLFARMAGYGSYKAIPGIKTEKRGGDKGLRVDILREAVELGKIGKYCNRYQSEKLRKEVDIGFNGMRLYPLKKGFMILDEEANNINCDTDLETAVKRIFDQKEQ